MGLLGGAAAAWPLAARAQQRERTRRIGVLMAYGESDSEAQAYLSAFRGELQKLGWAEDHNIRIETRWAALDIEAMQRLAKELVSLQPDLILSQVTPTTAALMQQTRTIPIIFALVTDPVGSGLVASLARPGGNTTGLSMQTSDAAGKRLELLRELLPGLRRLAVIGNPGYPAAVYEIGEVRRAARALGLGIDIIEIRSAEDIAGTFPVLKSGPQALYVCADPLVNANHARINTLALGARLPTIYPVRDFLGAGGFTSYGPSLVHSFRRAADYADKILRGAKPGDLPVEQPTKFDLVFNLTTARALDQEIPATLLARADEVIE